MDVLLKIIYFFAISAPGEVSLNKIAKSLRKDHSTIASYVQMLRDTSLLRFLASDQAGHAFIRKAEKIFLNDTNLLYAINFTLDKIINTGQVRETFCLNALDNCQAKVSYSKVGDLSIGGYLVEIGGRSKTRSQIAHFSRQEGFLVKDDVIYAEQGDHTIVSFWILRLSHA